MKVFLRLFGALSIAAVACAEIRFDDADLDILNQVDAADNWPPPFPEQTNRSVEWRRVMTAATDACYCSEDVVYNSVCSAEQMDAGCLNRNSESYAWGMTRTKEKVFVGTVADLFCFGNPFGAVFEDGYVACTGSDLDWQLPSVYMYEDVGSAGVDDDDHREDVIKISSSVSGEHFERLNKTLGLRAAGNRNGVVIFAGPARASLTPTVYFFAFDSETGEFLDSAECSHCNDVRKFTMDLDQSMYLGISLKDDSGLVLRYVGSRDTDPLAFESIAHLDGNPAEISFYEDRLVVGTWSASGDLDMANAKPARMLVSPLRADLMPALPLSARSRLAGSGDGKGWMRSMESIVDAFGDWPVLWSIEEYEPDPVTATTYGVSVSVQVGEWLYWGTVQFPSSGLSAFINAYGKPANMSMDMIHSRTRRACTLFRGRFLKKNGGDLGTWEVELLYGERALPVYDPAARKWSVEANRASNKTPRLGRSGFSNLWNMYLWSMSVLEEVNTHSTGGCGYVPSASGKSYTLLIGTYDQWNDGKDETDDVYGFRENVMGADLYLMRIEDTVITGADAGSNSSCEIVSVPFPVEWVSLTGITDEYNYGVRNILSDVNYDPLSREVTVGTASGYNLPSSSGFEVIKMKIL